MAPSGGAGGCGSSVGDEFEQGRVRIVRQCAAELLVAEETTQHVLAQRNGQLQEDVSTPSTARLVVQEVRIPLVWSLKQHFKQKDDARRYCLFAVLSAGGAAAGTRLARAIHAAHTDVLLVAAHAQPICFEHVLPSTKINVDIYATREDIAPQSAEPVESDSPRPVTPTGARLNAFKGSLTRSLGAKFGTFAGRQSHARPTSIPDRRSPDSASSGGFGAMFHLVASTSVSLHEVANGDKQNVVASLYLATVDDNVCPPLDVTVCCRVQIRPASTLAPLCSSFAEIKHADGRATKGHFDLMCGAIRPSGGASMQSIIRVNAHTICQVGRQRRTVIVTVPRSAANGASKTHSEQFVLVADDAAMWQRAFHQLIRDIRTWHRWAEAHDACDNAAAQSANMPVARRRSQRFPVANNGRSLYDQISINTSRDDDDDEAHGGGGTRPLIDYRCLRAPWLDTSLLAVATGNVPANGDSEADPFAAHGGVQRRLRDNNAAATMGDKRARRRSLTAMLFRQKAD